MKRIHLVATGGTVDSSRREGVLSLDPEGRPPILDFLPKETACTWSRPFSILSEDADSTRWSQLARHIAALPLADLDAILVSHGSDTLSWTAAALSFALRGVPLPVVLFGADKPLEDGSSNGPDNFRSAASFAVSEGLPGFFVSWRNPGEASTIHLATRLLPADPHLDRFRSPLDAPFGTMADGTFSRLSRSGNPSRSDLAVRAEATAWLESVAALKEPSPFEDRVLVLADHPGMDHSPLLETIGRWKAVVQIAHHSGTASSSERPGSLLHLARAARDAGVPVILGPSRPRAAYSSRAPLLDAGVRVAPHQSWPSLVVKIRHLLGQGRLDRLEEDLAWELL